MAFPGTTMKPKPDGGTGHHKLDGAVH